MLDLGTSFLASVARDPDVAGDRRRRRAADLRAMVRADIRARRGLRPHRPEDAATTWSPYCRTCEAAATLHWACQLAGIVITPFNWRAKADELDYCLEDSEARAVVYQDVSAAGGRKAPSARGICRVFAWRRRCHRRVQLRPHGRRACGPTRRLASAPKPGRSCSIHPAPPRGPRACRGGSAPSAPPESRMSRKISTGAASARSA